MNRKVIFPLCALLIFGAAFQVSAQGTAFFYQGRLNDGGSPATNVYDLRFALFDAATNGNLIAAPQTNFAVAVNSGMFATNVDFGAVFTGTNYWLALGVRTNAGVAANTNAFTLLWPRQPLLPVPYAVFAETASNLSGTLSAAQLTGTLPSAQVAGNYFGAVNFNNSTNTFLGTFSGNGLNLTNLNGSNIVTGTVADARLSTNVALLNTNQTFTGVNVFNNATNSFTGSFFGNGLVGWIPVPSNTVQAVRDTGYLLQSSNLTTVTLPSSNLFAGDIIRISGAGSGGWLIAQNTNQSVLGNFLSNSNASWIQASSASSANVALAVSADGRSLVASTYTGSGVIYYSQNSGQNWSTATYSLTAPIALAATAKDNLFYGCVAGSTVSYSTNSGASWNQITGTVTNWHGLAASYDGTRLVGVAYGGSIYTSTNSGNNWQNTGASGGQNWYAVAASADCQKIVAAIYGGKIYVSTNFGSSWAAVASSQNWSSVASSADGVRLAAVVYGGGVYTSGDSGLTWIERSNAPTAVNWHSIASSASGAQLLGACNGGVYFSANEGATWSLQPIGSQNWTAAGCSDDASVMAVGSSPTSTTGQIEVWQPVLQFTGSTTGTNGSLTGSQGSAVELQYIGNNQFMPVGGTGNFWAN